MSGKYEVFDRLECFLTPEILPLFSRDKWLVPPAPDIPEGNVREILRSLQVWKPQSLNLALTPIRNPVTGLVRTFKEAEADSVSKMQIELLSRERNTEKSEENENKDRSANIISIPLLTVPPGLNEGIPYPTGNFRFNDFPTLSESEVPLSSANILERLKFKLSVHAISEVNDSSESGSEFDSDDESMVDDDDIQVEHYRSKPVEVKEEGVILKPSRQQPLPLPKAKSWAYPVDLKNTPVADFHTMVSRPARNWPFELDTFQKQAVIYLEQHRDVFVSAHTSAGKTVVAEYAIALSKQHNKRTIYTSPIKALSNQKFREFKHHFEDVGLITGDIQINPMGTCLIMTTEILRSMLYNRSAIIWELDWVIFDECHYINDADRGVVWEEVIIMLPSRISIILLSATIANPLDFAEWVGRIKERRIYVISTSHRPVPLEHYLFTGNSNRTSNYLFKIVDEHRSFSMPAYTRAVESTKPQPSGPCASTVRAQALAAASMGSGDRGRGIDRGKGRGGRGQQHHHRQVRIPTSGSGAGWEGAEKTFWFAVIQMLKADERLPAVVFVFSKARIDQISLLLYSADLLTKSEQNTVHCFIQSCLKRLKPQDRRIPQLRNVQELLVRGIGIHHSGILPFLREIVELLFQKSLVKVLFATETFAMGVNMPARTVLFDSIRKFDGKGRRLLLPGEYTQMAGRAGRRGLDNVGSVIVLCRNGEVPQMGDLQKMLLGKPTPLESRFRLTYAMMLSLLRHDSSRVFDMMRRSFGEFGDQVSLERRKLRRQEVTEKLRLWSKEDCQHCIVDLEKYVRLGLELVRLRETTWTDICKLQNFSKLLCCGRLIIFMKCRPGIVLQSGNKSVKVFSFSPLPTPVYLGSDDNLIAIELLPPSGFHLVNPDDGEEFIPTMTEVSFDKIDGLCDTVIRLDNRMVQEINDDISKRRMARLKCDPYAKATKATLKELHRQLLLNDSNLTYWTGASSDIVAANEALKVELMQLQEIEVLLTSNRFLCLQCPDLKTHLKDMEEKVRLVDELEDLKRDSDETHNRLQLQPEYHQRLGVLRDLGFVDPRGHIRLKGRMACAISSHELVITELVLTGQLEKIEASELAALFSAFIFEHRRLHDDEPSDPRNKKLPASLKEAQSTLVSVAERVGQVQKQCGMKEAVEDFVNHLNFDLTAVVLEWARGMPFKDIAESTEVQEGIIVRTVVRLDELLRNVADAAHVLGNPVLQEKMKEASQKIKRDIIFAASLYTD